MKNYLSLLFFFSIFLISAKQIKLVSSIKIFSLIAQEIGGDLINSQFIIRENNSIHDYQLNIKDLYKIKSSNMVIAIGLGEDLWLKKALQKKHSIKEEAKYLDLSKFINIIDNHNYHEEEHNHEEIIHNQGNPHYWLNPHNGLIIGKAILYKLKTLYPKHIIVFEQNYKKFYQKLNEKIYHWKKISQKYKNWKLIHYHRAWDYLDLFLNWKIIGHFENINHQTVNVKNLLHISQETKKHPKTLAIISEYYNKDNLKKILYKPEQYLILSNRARKEDNSYIQFMSYIFQEIEQTIKKFNQ